MAVGLFVAHARSAQEHIEDALAPARGIVIGLVLSAFLWVLVAFLAMRL